MILEWLRLNRLPFFARGQQKRAHGGRLADADGRYRGLDIAHGVKDRHAGCYHAAGRVDVKMDILVRHPRLPGKAAGR